MTAGFPSFIEWLAGQPDEALTAIRPTALHDVTDVASLRSIDLLLLHAATELDAAAQPATVSELMETVEELLNIAGTPAELRPQRAELDVAVLKLASHGFIYGPNWKLSPTTSSTTPLPASSAWEFKIAPTVASYFDPATTEAWALADHHRCPIPTAEIAEIVEALPPRQRRLVQTLHASGGVGHSASVGPDGDPQAPLPTMVRGGLLDQLDDTTVRLTGRVEQYLNDAIIAEPGGDFRPTDCPRYSQPRDAQQHKEKAPELDGDQGAGNVTSTTSDPITATAVSNAVQTILELTELLTDLSQHPIDPLTNGGIGLRNLSKTAKRLNISEDDLTARLTLAIETGLIATGYFEPSAEEFPAPYWGITQEGKQFLSSELGTQWAQLLLGWAHSSYAPWAAESLDVRAFEPALFLLPAVRARQCFPFCFPTPTAEPTPTPPSPPSIPQTMWRVNPAVAHAATQGMWDELFSEARRLGLMVDATAAFSMAELATVLSSPNGARLQEVQSSLSTRLSHLLPKPVQYLIIQSDHTIMAPGLLSPSDAARLRSIAVQESSGMASVWRVTTEAILRAYTDGATREELEGFLAAMTPGGWPAVPQSLQYTIADAERLYQNATANPTPLFHKTPHYVVTTITNPESNEEEAFFWDGEWETIISAVENQRLIMAEEAEGGAASESKESNSAPTLRELPEIKQALRRAMRMGHPIVVRYVEPNGQPTQRTIEVVMAEPARVVGVETDSRDSVQVQISNIEWIRPAEVP